MHKREDESSWAYWKLIWSDESESEWDKLDKEFDRVYQVVGFVALFISLTIFLVGGNGVQWPILIVSQVLIWLPVHCYWQEDKWERDWEKRNERRN